MAVVVRLLTSTHTVTTSSASIEIDQQQAFPLRQPFVLILFGMPQRRVRGTHCSQVAADDVGIAARHQAIDFGCQLVRSIEQFLEGRAVDPHKFDAAWLAF